MGITAAKLGDPDLFSKLGCCDYPPNVLDFASPTTNVFFLGGVPAVLDNDPQSPVPGIWTCSGGGFCLLPRTVSAKSKKFQVRGRYLARLGDTTSIPSGRIITTSAFNNVVVS